ncbi:hypothetical protein P879_05897 [Paragonimus westermani]|uniref:Glycerol-3-phosphate dehydrogenase [NAD(+)] n=1 Tax=Paragonimus westermani TaxID=34504 RepID=A0A8T0DAR5_9TREM|nr:hypothetical protein P879_05897 [Paragonimus westermani]
MKQVAVLGCGAWGTAVARLMAGNVKNSEEFHKTVTMFVHDEKYSGESLADSINRMHVNPVYLPGFKLPKNVIASCDLEDIVLHADILAIVYPTRLIPWLLDRLQPFVVPTAYFITFCKGVVIDHDDPQIHIVSDLVREKTNRPCVAVIGATTAMEVAWQHFTEATIGCSDMALAQQTKRLLQTNYFRLTITPDAIGVELCGALKHVVAIAAGIADGLGLGDNTRAAILRLGFWEMFELMNELFPNRGVESRTIEQSCGIAELFVCMSHRSDQPPALGSDMDLMNMILGRNLTAERRASVDNFEQPPLRQRRICVNGAEYAEVIYKILRSRNRLSQFPLFTAVHLICQHTLSPAQLIESLQVHPLHN